MPTLDELADRLAVVEQRLGIGTPGPTPPQDPEPLPPSGPPRPATPPAPDVVIGQDGRPVLTWQVGANTTAWEVHDLANPGKTLQATVTEPRSVRSALKPGQRRRYALVAVGPGGRSQMSVSTDVPPASEPTPTPDPTPTPEPGTSSAPGSVLDLSRWYLTLPIAPPAGDEDTSGPWDIYQPRLATFSHELFRTGSDQHGRYVEYTAPTKGVTTSGSGATRCELRQMTGPSREAKAAWSFADGKPHTLTCTLTCDGTSIVGRKEVIVGQIHGPGGTPPLILCVNHTRGGALEVFRQGPRQGDLLTGLQPGELFTYRIDASDGRLRLYACRGTADQLPTTAAFDWSASVLTEQSGCYFKAGAYGKQEVGTATTGQSVVRHYRLDLV
jgi:hypothetical protein